MTLQTWTALERGFEAMALGSGPRLAATKKRLERRDLQREAWNEVGRALSRSTTTEHWVKRQTSRTITRRGE